MLLQLHAGWKAGGAPAATDNWREINIAEGRVRQLWSELLDKAGAEDSPPALRDAVAQVKERFFAPFTPLQERVARAGLGDGKYDLTPAEWRRQTAPMLTSIMLLRDAAIAEATRDLAGDPRLGVAPASPPLDSRRSRQGTAPPATVPARSQIPA